jgi:hypothetical protein
MAMEQAHPGAGTLRTILWVDPDHSQHRRHVEDDTTGKLLRCARPAHSGRIHCIECPKQSGSAFAIGAVIPQEQFRITKGNP